LSIAVTMLSYVVRAYRWQVLLAHLKAIRIQPLVTTTIIGFSAIYLLGRAGEIVRPLWVTRRERIPLSASVATILVERFLDSLMLVAAFAGALIMLKLPATAGPSLTLLKNAAWVVVLVSIAAVVALVVFRSNIERIVKFIPFPKVASFASNFSK